MNRLANETSPYLLQHANNPVDWFSWSDEALQKAKTEDKPILVSIGYSSCHWCHVMEKESFEDDSTAQIMNEYFINIKIDREERPDLDHIYMDAVQAMAGNGGWPLNVFLTPHGKPFYGGTYFPPQRAFNRPSWKEVLLNVSEIFTNRRDEVETQADTLIKHIEKSNSFGKAKSNSADNNILFSQDSLDIIFQNIMKQADTEWGGFGKTPKFPQTITIQYLLRYYHFTKKEEALKQAVLSLDKMIQGGIYDHLQGGFARYSTDTEWLAPHFEKMLYDNALLISVLSEAYQLTKKSSYKEVILQTIDFVKTELMHPDFGFYSAMDADSEGEEGTYYVWSYKEVLEVLGENSTLFCEFFDISPNGNWEGKNILRIKTPVAIFAKERSISLEVLEEILSNGKKELLKKRNERIKPLLDDKVILSWNALMNTALSKAYAALSDDRILDLAVKNMNFIVKNLVNPDTNGLCHTWKDKKAKHPAFLDDFAFLIQALIYLGQTSSDVKWIDMAAEFSHIVIKEFSDEEAAFFYYTNKAQEDVIVRKKEVYDGAQPSANAVMAENLFRLSILLNDHSFKSLSEQSVWSLSTAILQNPGSFSKWACLLMDMVYGLNEIAIVGVLHDVYLKELLALYIPNKLCMASRFSNKDYPLIARKNVNKEQTFIFLCKNYSCQKPVKSIIELQEQLSSVISIN